jgi:four helix bundle protein
MQNFRTLDLAVAFYRQVTGLKLPHHLKDQLLRASSSIALNLAEGRGKPTSRDQLRYFHIAMGSLRESQAVLLLASDIDPSLSTQADRLGASLFLLIRHAKK